MRRHGQEFEVYRNGEKISVVEGLNNREEGINKSYIGFFPNTDVKSGDWIKGIISNEYLYIEDVNTQVVKKEVFQLKGYYLTKHEYKKRSKKDEAATIIYNLNGKNSKVNNNSNDHSINIVDMSSADLFDKVRKVIETNITEEEVKSLNKIVDEMEGNQNTSKFNQSYTKFIANAANHVTLIAPFIPALTQLIQG